MTNTESTRVWFYIPGTNTMVTGTLLGYVPGSTNRVRVRRDDSGKVAQIPISIVRPLG